MWDQKESRLAVRVIESQVKFPSPLELRAAAGVTIVGISADGRDQLLVEKVPGDFQNLCGNLLLPHNLHDDHRETIRRNNYESAVVIYDAEGRVHQLVLRAKIFLLMMDEWKVMRTLRTMHTEIVGVDPATATLQTIGRESSRFRLPWDSVKKFEGWQPEGSYQIDYDTDLRVYRISQSETNLTLDVGLDWDSRFIQNPMKYSHFQKQRNIVRRNNNNNNQDHVESIDIEGV